MLIKLDAVFNRRIAQFLKLIDKVDTRSLRNIMKLKIQSYRPYKETC